MKFEKDYQSFYKYVYIYTHIHRHRYMYMNTWVFKLERDTFKAYKMNS